MKKITFLIVLLTLLSSWYGTAQITTYPYSEDFEAGAGGWVATNGTNGTWALGAPTATIINSAASGANAWATNLSGNYNASENSFVQSPVFDLSTLSAPSIQFSIWWNAEFSYDGMVLQSSIDSGASWQNVGAFGDPNNWYNNSSINGNPGGQQEGWTGRGTANGSQGWRIARHALTGLAGQSNVIFRFAFGADGSLQDNGVAFDLVTIFDVSCPEPSGLTGTVTLTTVNLSWTNGGSETDWEFINQLAGEAAPTNSDSGTLIESNFVEIMNLTEGSDYEFYVRADCLAEGFSTWVGPFTYSISGPGETCSNPIVVTNPLPYSTDDNTSNYGDDYSGSPGANCGSTNGYLGGDDVVYSYTPTSDTSITITMTPGGTWSGLFVYDDCAAIGVNCLAGAANAGSTVREIELAVTAGTTYYIVISTWPAPQSVPYNLTITENTCTDAVANYTVRQDCLNGPQFFVDVNLTDLGSATSITLSDNQGSTAQTTSATGLFTFGPFPNNTNVIITVTNDDDANCTLTSTSLTQEFCQDFIVDCSVGPQTLNYCYSDGGATNPVIFTYSSNDGTPLRLTFNSGYIEEGWDELVVIDTDGSFIVAPGDLFYGNNGDLSGLTYQSSGDTISFYINSDGVFSCQTSGYVPIDVTATCATCVNPTATYEVRSDCFTAPQFFVDVDVTDLGSANSLTLTDNQGSAPQTVTTVGLVTFGPFPNATDVQITVANDDDVNCVRTSGVLTQEFCLDSQVDCAVGPLNVSYCYTNSDSNVFSYVSTDGSPLNLTINSGEIEGSPFDFLIILDSDGVTELYNGEGNNGNLSGLTFQSTGDTIYFSIQSDTSVSCASGSYAGGINYTVACATCINPAATYSVIDDCENGAQFLIDVNITSLGDATSLTVTDNQGSTGVPVTATGVVQMGPYPFATPIIITISNDQDVNCVINSSPIQVAACPPANDNCQGATVAVVNPGESCDSVTSGTLLAATPSGVPVGSCGGNPNDDVWFQFTALGEQQIIQLQNFNGGTTNIDHAVYTGVCGSLVELYCSPDSFSLTPSLTIGNTYYIRVFSAGSVEATTTFDLCIQTLGIPTYCTEALPICASDLVYPSIVGNDVAPPYLDYGCLGSQPDPTWNSIYFDTPGDYTFTLAQTGLDGIGNDIDFIVWGPFTSQESGCYDLLPASIADCSFSFVSIETVELNNVQAGDVYIILITNFSQDEGTYTFTQASGPENGTNCEIVCDVVIEYQDTEILEDTANPGFAEPIELCDFESITLTASSPYADNYEWYNDNIPMDVYTETITVTESGIYSVVVFGGVCEGPSQSIQVPVVLGTSPTANPLEDIVTCDDISGDGFEDFDLESQTATVLGGQDATQFNVTYHLSQEEAVANTGALTSPYTNITNPQTIYVRVEDANATFCFATTSFNLVISGPTPTASSVDIELCEDGNDGTEQFNLTAHNANVLNGQSATDYTVTYYASEGDASTGTSPLASPYTNTSNPQTIWARVDNNTAVDCYTVIDFDLIVSEIPVTSFTTDLEYEICPNVTVPLVITATPQNYTASEVTIVWYQDGGVIQGETGLTLPVLVGGLYEIEVTFNGTNCPAEPVGITVVQLENCIIPQGISPNNDGKNDTFDLTNFDVQRIEIFNRLGTLVYSKDNYTNEWYGQTDNGDELPVGTYFYTMIYEGGAKTKSSWVYINK